MYPHSWYESIRSAMTSWKCLQLLLVFLLAGTVICKEEILIRSVNEGLWYWTYLNKKKIICLLIFPLLYCQVRLSTVTPIITKSSSSARGIRQLQIAVRLTSQWSGKCAVNGLRQPIKDSERYCLFPLIHAVYQNQRFHSLPYWFTRCIQI